MADLTLYVLIASMVLFFFFIFLLLRRTFTGFMEGVEKGSGKK